MVLLLRHLMCLVIESGFCIIESGVSIHPVELVVYQHPARLVSSCQCQHPTRLCYQHLGFHPVGCCSSCWFSPGIGLLSGYYPVGRSPSLVETCRSLIAIYTVVIGERLVFRDSYHDSVSRIILDGGR